MSIKAWESMTTDVSKGQQNQSYSIPSSINLHDIGSNAHNLYKYDEIQLTPPYNVSPKDDARYHLQSKNAQTFEDKIERFDLSKRKRSDAASSFNTASNRRDQYKHVSDSDNESQIRSECWAPPGKLGVAIDTVDGQPVIHQIKAGSPLEGVLQRMDRIVAIDGVSTANMSAADVTYLMVKRMKQKRRITFLRAEAGQSLMNLK